MTPASILIVQLRRIGDVLCTMPVIGVLRRSFPKAEIDFLVEEPSDQLVRLDPHLDGTLVYKKEEAWSWIRRVRAGRYDWVLDFHANGRTLVLTALSGAPVRAGFAGPVTRRLAYDRLIPGLPGGYIVEQKMELLKGLGVADRGWKWELPLPEAEKAWTESLLRESGISGSRQRIVGIAPASRRAARRWLPERFSEVMKELKSRGCHVVLLWGPGERDFVESLARAAGPDGAGRTLIPPPATLLQSSALIARCDLVLATDNGPKNIAIALGVPTVTVMGPTNPLSFNPHDDPAHVVLRDDALFCIACAKNECPYGHECMEHVTARRAVDKILAMFGQG